jgi:hypothetical protein
MAIDLDHKGRLDLLHELDHHDQTLVLQLHNQLMNQPKPLLLMLDTGLGLDHEQQKLGLDLEMYLYLSLLIMQQALLLAL